MHQKGRCRANQEREKDEGEHDAVPRRLHVARRCQGYRVRGGRSHAAKDHVMGPLPDPPFSRKPIAREHHEEVHAGKQQEEENGPVRRHRIGLLVSPGIELELSEDEESYDLALDKQRLPGEAEFRRRAFHARQANRHALPNA